MIELFSTETKPVYIGYNKLAADVAEATTDALTGADYIALQATIKYLWFMVISDLSKCHVRVNVEHKKKEVTQ